MPRPKVRPKTRTRIRGAGEPHLVAEIRLAIADGPLNPNALARAAGIDQSSLRKFLTRERSLTLISAAGLFDALGLKVIRGRKRLGKASGVAEDDAPDAG